MNLTNISKLDRLSIKAFKTSKRNGSPTDSFEAYVNIDGFSQSYAIQYQCTGGIGSSSQEAKHSKNLPKKLQLDLILDNTAVFQSDLGIGKTKGKSIVEQVNSFLSVCYEYKGSAHSPQCLKIEWGEIKLDCKLEKADIKYSLFDKGGIPLRAEIAVVFIEDVPASASAKKQPNESADISHSHLVKAGDTLPLIAKEVYGNASYYLQVAKANRLNHFRELKAGMELSLPSLQALEQFK